MKKVKVILYQKPLGINISRRDIDEMHDFGPDFICFPEYFFVNTGLGNHGQTEHNQCLQKKRLELLSKKLKAAVIGGTMPELSGGLMYNTSYVYDNGSELGFYRKKHLFFAEVGKITPGDEYKIFKSRGITFGVLICADVFEDGAFEFMKKKGAEIIFSPTFSLYKEETTEIKFKRDEDIYVRASGISGAVIVKVCGVKSDYKPFIQARSLISDSKGVIYRVGPDEEDRSMIIKKEISL
ncbi:MAG: carbon-nitrogen hydrolase family protein [Spirochaetes bacterium]|jgi:predicted amidohydrolase|nr:carbon-nitrogen hydrolase family protein [Spirochaetota bacterium]